MLSEQTGQEKGRFTWLRFKEKTLNGQTDRKKVYLLTLFAILICAVVLTLPSKPLREVAKLPAPPGLIAAHQPMPMHPFSLVEVGGTTVRSADLRGHVIVMRFWATW